MAGETRDRLPWILPLVATGILIAAYVGTALAKLNAPQAVKPTPVATNSPSPSPIVPPSPASKKESTPTRSPTAQLPPTGWMRVKESPDGCQVGYDFPDEARQKVGCFFSGQTFASTGEQKNGFTALTSGPNKFWIETQFLEPVQQPDSTQQPSPSPAMPQTTKTQSI